MGFNEEYTKESHGRYVWKTTDDKLNETDLIMKTKEFHWNHEISWNYNLVSNRKSLKHFNSLLLGLTVGGLQKYRFSSV